MRSAAQSIPAGPSPETNSERPCAAIENQYFSLATVAVQLSRWQKSDTATFIRGRVQFCLSWTGISQVDSYDMGDRNCHFDERFAFGFFTDRQRPRECYDREIHSPLGVRPCKMPESKCVDVTQSLLKTAVSFSFSASSYEIQRVHKRAVWSGGKTLPR